MPTIGERLKHGWNAFVNNKDPSLNYRDLGGAYSYRPDRMRFTRGNERTIANSIYTRIALDVASLEIKHIRTDEKGDYLEEIDSGLNNILNLEANKDQTARAFIQDTVQSMFDEGCVACVPVDTTYDPMSSETIKIESMRTGKITEWYPNHVKILLYNDRVGRKEEIMLPKSKVAIIENPFYSVMNEPNSTLKRLVRKLALLDSIDEQSGSGKLDLIIQLPYVIKSEARRQQAEQRRKDIEMQLSGSKYGIAYTDGTEHITQLNRSLENNLMKQIEYLTNLLYSELGITAEIMNGTANEETMLNYESRTIEPIISAIVDEFKRKFLTKTARSQRQTIKFFRDPFRLVPMNSIANMADTFTRNEIMTSNEIRTKIGLRPATDPKADELRNKNINQSSEETMANSYDVGAYRPQEIDQDDYKSEMAQLDEVDDRIDDLERMLNS